MGQLKDVSFEKIRYANCWEDADLLLEGLDLKNGNKILSIASGGDNSFSLLTTSPEIVVAIDVSQVQLYLVELKKEAIIALDQKSYLQFIGIREGSDRLNIYDNIKGKLSDEARQYWDENKNEIEIGLFHIGKFEKYLKAFGEKVLPLVHSKGDVKKLLSEKSESEQIEFFKKNWNNFRWRMLFKVFFSKFVLGTFGRDPKFLKEVDLTVSDYLLEKTEAHFSSTLAQRNWMLNYILQGKFKEHIPHYCREDNYSKVKANIDKLQLLNGYAEDAYNKYGSFDAFNLSNIFEYMDLDTFTSVTEQLTQAATENAKFAYWNLMVKRDLSTVASKDMTTSNISRSKDRGFFYRNFIVNQFK